MKTGRLFEAAVGCGLWAAGVPPAEHEPWHAFGADYGFLYQVVDDLIDQIGAGVRKRGTILHRAWDFRFTGQHLLEKFLRIVDLAGGGEQLHDLAQRVGRFPRAQLQRDVSFIEKISQIDVRVPDRGRLPDRSG